MFAEVDSILKDLSPRLSRSYHCPSIPAIKESLSQHQICVSSATTFPCFLLVEHLEPQRMPGCASLCHDPTHEASFLHPQPPWFPALRQSEALGCRRAPTAPLVCIQGQKSQREDGWVDSSTGERVERGDFPVSLQV